MAKKIKIEFISNPVPNVNLVLGVLYGSNSETTGVTIPSLVVDIGATKEDTALNLFNYYTGVTFPFEPPFPAWQLAIQTITISGNIIYFDFVVDNDNDLSFPALISSQSSITIEEVELPVASDFEIGLVRSTLSTRIIPNLNFDTATLQLYNWSGDINDVPITPSYSLSKPVVLKSP